MYSAAGSREHLESGSQERLEAGSRGRLGAGSRGRIREDTPGRPAIYLVLVGIALAAIAGWTSTATDSGPNDPPISRTVNGPAAPSILRGAATLHLVNAPAKVGIGSNSETIGYGGGPAAIRSGDNPAAISSSGGPAAIRSGDNPAAIGSSDDPAAIRSGDDPAAISSSDDPAAISSAGTKSISGDGAPPHPAHERLRTAAERYRQIVEEGGWPEIPPGEVLQEGDTSDSVIPLRERLVATGDLASEAATGDSEVYNVTIADAVIAFQRRHGLTVDGIVGPETRRALNMSARERLRMIERNLSRWESLPEELGERHILVNIPEFRLRAYSEDDVELTMKVIVGAEYDGRATPIFQDRMEYVVFRPYWNIPTSIANEEILPEARRDRSYLTRHNYEIVSHFAPDARVYDAHSTDLDRVTSGELHLRQKPGEHNALGLVKFMFPNEHAVYLHGTPEEHLFGENQRAFSHGCIRVGRPADLAEFVLSRQDEWTPGRIRAAMENGERQRVDLQDSIPVYILYFTVFVDEHGTVQFREDIYGHDESDSRLDFG